MADQNGQEAGFPYTLMRFATDWLKFARSRPLPEALSTNHALCEFRLLDLNAGRLAGHSSVISQLALDERPGSTLIVFPDWAKHRSFMRRFPDLTGQAGIYTAITSVPGEIDSAVADHNFSLILVDGAGSRINLDTLIAATGHLVQDQPALAYVSLGRLSD
jgi:hypothetical protein